MSRSSLFGLTRRTWSPSHWMTWNFVSKIWWISIPVVHSSGGHHQEAVMRLYQLFSPFAMSPPGVYLVPSGNVLLFSGPKCRHWTMCPATTAISISLESAAYKSCMLCCDSSIWLHSFKKKSMRTYRPIFPWIGASQVGMSGFFSEPQRVPKTALRRHEAA